jgi:hypothetical protein
LQPRPSTIVFTKICRAISLEAVLLFSSLSALAEPIQSHVVCRENINQSRREDLAKRLRKITGWPELRFDLNGVLRLGSKESLGGSATARELIQQSSIGPKFVVLEDTSNSAEVAFSRVIDGKWKNAATKSPVAFVVQIDFSDFDHLVGDRRALQAFDAGWALLHELDHVVNNSIDTEILGEVGACEDRINQMRRECDLPQRAEYFFTYLPFADVTFSTRLVRLAFEATDGGNKKKRYWVLWNAQLVGGVDRPQAVAMK